MQIELKKRVYYKVKEKQSLKEICRKFGIEESLVKLYNQVEEVSEGDVLFFPEISKNFYVVKPAESFSCIAKKLNLSERELLEKTGTRKLFIGQKIFL